MCIVLRAMMIMTDTDVLEAKVMTEEDPGVAPLITTIEDLIVLETVDRLEDHGVAEAIPTMIDSNTEIDLFQDLNPIQDHGPRHLDKTKRSTLNLNVQVSGRQCLLWLQLHFFSFYLISKLHF